MTPLLFLAGLGKISLSNSPQLSFLCLSVSPSPSRSISLSFSVSRSILPLSIDLFRARSPPPLFRTHSWLFPKKGEAILNEGRLYGDISPAFTIERYQHLMDKTIAIFRMGLDVADAALIVKMDDDWCGDVVKGFWATFVQLGRPTNTYAGVWSHVPAPSDTEPAVYRGAHNQTTQYMSGGCYALSRGLARQIFQENILYTSQHHVFGQSSEDVTVGLLVSRAERMMLARSDGRVDALDTGFPRSGNMAPGRGDQAGSAHIEWARGEAGVVRLNNSQWWLNITKAQAIATEEPEETSEDPGEDDQPGRDGRDA